MRRREKEITDQSVIESILQRATVCRIGLCDRGTPYVVPVNFGYEDHRLYFHSAGEGRKVDVLKENNRVCFEVDIDVELLPAETACQWSVKYLSVIGFGEASFVDDLQEKQEALNIIMEHYAGRSYEYPEQTLAKVAVIKVEIDTMSGKQSGLRAVG
jgi:nitroimidazol reductase NimA-like FMN-containing flavoprotein (pyridoxamine 5'-phosphate oxidase superfamily)